MESTLRVVEAVFVKPILTRMHSPVGSDENPTPELSVCAFPEPPVVFEPLSKSHHLAVAAIMLRAELFTVDGFCPSAQPIEESAALLVAAVVDQSWTFSPAI